jgi:hypothetical protein
MGIPIAIPHYFNARGDAPPRHPVNERPAAGLSDKGNTALLSSSSLVAGQAVERFRYTGTSPPRPGR